MKIDLNCKKIIADEEKILAEAKKRLASLPKASLCYRKAKGHFRYSLRSKSAGGKIHETYLPDSKKQFVRQCCTAVYLRKLIPVLEHEVKALKQFSANYSPEAKTGVWNRLPEGIRQNTEPLFRSNRDICRAWEREEFESNTFPGRGDQYLTKKGEAVRSRIEMIVANTLHDLGIPYRYECRLSLPSGPIYPDFTVMHPDTLELYYIEIFGMMSDPEYEKAAFVKIAKYAASDVYPHLLMFFDHKNAPISTASVMQTLKKMFCS